MHAEDQNSEFPAAGHRPADTSLALDAHPEPAERREAPSLEDESVSSPSADDGEVQPAGDAYGRGGWGTGPWGGIPHKKPDTEKG